MTRDAQGVEMPDTDTDTENENRSVEIEDETAEDQDEPTGQTSESAGEPDGSDEDAGSEDRSGTDGSTNTREKVSAGAKESASKATDIASSTEDALPANGSKTKEFVLPLIAGVLAGAATYAVRRAPDIVRAVSRRAQNGRAGSGRNASTTGQ